MAWWPVQEKQVPAVIVELLAKATRPKRADQPSPRLRRASWRSPLLVAQRATLRRALLARAEQQSGRLARAFFAPGRQL